MKTKKIQFDLETAKKIQAGEIEGKIKSINGHEIKTIIRINGAKTYNNEQLSLVEYVNETIDFTFFKGLFIELPEKTPEHKFKPFDKVLVRNDVNSIWQPSIFTHQLGDSFYTVSLYPYEKEQILPYEGNEHLVGTTNNPK